MAVCVHTPHPTAGLRQAVEDFPNLGDHAERLLQATRVPADNAGSPVPPQFKLSVDADALFVGGMAVAMVAFAFAIGLHKRIADGE